MSCFISEEEKEARRINKEVEDILRNDKKVVKNIHQLLLLGTGDSGKSTFIKQMRIIHGSGYSEQEKRAFIPQVFTNMIVSMNAMIGYLKKNQRHVHPDLEKECGLIQSFSFVKSHDLDIFSALDKLWNDNNIQWAFEKKNDYQLYDSTSYYYNDRKRILSTDFIPTLDDILHVRSPTTGINEYSFNIDKVTFRMVDVGGQRSERKKWINCFSSITAVLFLIAASEYDQKLHEHEETNRMVESKSLFKTILHLKLVQSFIVFFNKIDLFKEKLARSPLNKYLSQYNGDPYDVEAAMEFIRKMFIDLNEDPETTIYSHFTCATDTENIRFVFAVVKDTILQNNLKQYNLV